MAEPADKHEMSDDELLRIVLYGGDQEAFSVLVKRHQDSLWRIARRIAGNATVAADACQETWLNLVKCINERRYDIRSGRFRPFLHKVLYNEIMNIYRIEARLKRAGKGAKKEQPSNVDGPVKNLIAAEDQKKYKSALLKYPEALLKLPEKERKAFVLRNTPPYESFSNIARILGVVYNTARSYEKDAADKLREILGKGEIDYA